MDEVRPLSGLLLKLLLHFDRFLGAEYVMTYATLGQRAGKEMIDYFNKKIMIFQQFISTTTLCGVITGISGVMLAVLVAAGEANLGRALLLESIAAAVIGGVSLTGRSRRIFGAVLGAFFLGLMLNGTSLIRLSSCLQMIIISFLLIVSIVADRYISTASNKFSLLHRRHVLIKRISNLVFLNLC